MLGIKKQAPAKNTPKTVFKKFKIWIVFSQFPKNQRIIWTNFGVIREAGGQPLGNLMRKTEFDEEGNIETQPEI